MELLLDKHLIPSEECRVCLKKVEIYTSLFLKNDFNTSCTNAEMIMQCASVEIFKYDGMPQYICYDCLENLETAYEFKKTCELSYKILRERNMVVKEEILNGENYLNSYSDDKSKFPDFNFTSDYQNGVTQKADLNDLICKEEDYDDRNWMPPEDLFDEQNVIKKEERKDKRIFKNFNRNSRYPCALCKNVFSSSRKLQLHRDQQHTYCIMCEKQYGTFQIFKKHISRMHRDNTTNNTSFLCPYCGVKFTFNGNLNQHIRQKHLEERRFQCQDCNKKFLFESELKSHRAYTHPDEKNYACDVCGKLFALMRQLRRHSVIHLDVYNFKCDICDKSYKTPRHLKVHMRIHAEVKKFVCEYCERAFTLEKYLKKHIYTHTGEKPLQCKQCDKRFIQYSSLHYHIRKHHP